MESDEWVTRGRNQGGIATGGDGGSGGGQNWGSGSLGGGGAAVSGLNGPGAVANSDGSAAAGGQPQRRFSAFGGEGRRLGNDEA